jgi:hypothetical protein
MKQLRCHQPSWGQLNVVVNGKDEVLYPKSLELHGGGK